MEDMERLRKKLDDNRISLNEDTRRKELNEEKLRKEERSKERLARNTEETKIYRLTLETVDKPKLQLIMFPGSWLPPRSPRFRRKLLTMLTPISSAATARRSRRSIRTRRSVQYPRRFGGPEPRPEDGQRGNSVKTPCARQRGSGFVRLRLINLDAHGPKGSKDRQIHCRCAAVRASNLAASPQSDARRLPRARRNDEVEPAALRTPRRARRHGRVQAALRIRILEGALILKAGSDGYRDGMGHFGRITSIADLPA